MAGFLSRAAVRGLPEALEAAGLAQYVGQDAETVISAVVLTVAPSGNGTEETAARAAVGDVMAWLYDEYISEPGAIAALEQMRENDLRAAIERSVWAYVYQRWLQELGLSIEKGAVSPEAAVRLEQTIKEYVRDCVRLDFQEMDVLAIDWEGEAGEQIVAELFCEAYELLEAAT